tara:strand:- start:19342 stop:19554 length:213 start_codon:yes stop_codon:yes gene_type:complete
MKTIAQVLVERDKISKEDADEQVAEFKLEIAELLDVGRHRRAYELWEEVADLLAGTFGLEPDYLEEVLPF